MPIFGNHAPATDARLSSQHRLQARDPFPGRLRSPHPRELGPLAPVRVPKEYWHQKVAELFDEFKLDYARSKRNPAGLTRRNGMPIPGLLRTAGERHRSGHAGAARL